MKSWVQVWQDCPELPSCDEATLKGAAPPSNPLLTRFGEQKSLKRTPSNVVGWRRSRDSPVVTWSPLDATATVVRVGLNEAVADRGERGVSTDLGKTHRPGKASS